MSVSGLDFAEKQGGFFCVKSLMFVFQSVNPRGNGALLVEGVLWQNLHSFRSAVSGEDLPARLWFGFSA